MSALTLTSRISWPGAIRYLKENKNGGSLVLFCICGCVVVCVSILFEEGREGRPEGMRDLLLFLPFLDFLLSYF